MLFFGDWATGQTALGAKNKDCGKCWFEANGIEASSAAVLNWEAMPDILFLQPFVSSRFQHNFFKCLIWSLICFHCLEAFCLFGVFIRGYLLLGFHNASVKFFSNLGSVHDFVRHKLLLVCFFGSKRCTASSPVAWKAKHTDIKIAHKPKQKHNKPKTQKRATPIPTARIGVPRKERPTTWA